MKYWLSHLPCEVWVDVFRYNMISREELGRMVDRVGNRKYGEYLQFYLHDWGKRTLKSISIRQDGFYNFVGYEPHNLLVPQTPMPDNIRHMKYINISHFDQQTIDFLRRIRPILSDVQLEFYDIEATNLPNVRIILDNLVPFLGRIHSLRSNVLALPTIGQCLGQKLAKIKALEIAYYEEHAGIVEIGILKTIDTAMRQAAVNFLVHWLTPAPSHEGIEPKMCELLLYNDNGFPELISAAIREEFLAARSPCTFALVIFVFYSQQGKFAEFHLTNGIGEELHGEMMRDKDIQITRHRANCGPELQERLIEHLTRNFYGRDRNSKIDIQGLTLGLIDGIAAPVNLKKDQQPSTSKKREFLKDLENEKSRKSLMKLDLLRVSF